MFKGRNSKRRLTRVVVLCSARYYIVFYICKKFQNNTLNGFQLTERTRVHGRNWYVLCKKGDNSKHRQNSATVDVICTSFYSVLHFCEGS